MTQLPPDSRRDRILDSAVPLFLRLGYKHTSTYAIATEAVVSKATLYGYWPNKARLFHALLVRESLRVMNEWEARIKADPLGGTVGPFFAHSFQALATSPLLWALYTRDTDTLGDAFRRRGQAVYTPRYQENLTFVLALQAAGVVRDDLSAETINHTMQALSLGMVTVRELVDPSILPPLEHVAATLADTMQRALAPANPASSERGKVAIIAFFDHMRALAVASLDQPAPEEDSE